MEFLLTFNILILPLVSTFFLSLEFELLLAALFALPTGEPF
jgi:hypothetical protein